MKIIILIVLLSVTSGCAYLSYEKCSKIDGYPEEKIEGTYIRFNIIEHNGCKLVVRYEAHKKKSLLIGPIVPLFPTLLPHMNINQTSERRVLLENRGDSGIIVLKKVECKNDRFDSTILVAHKELGTYIGYRNEEDTYAIGNAPKKLLELQTGECISIDFPRKETITLLIEMNGEEKVLKVEGTTSFSYWIAS